MQGTVHVTVGARKVLLGDVVLVASHKARVDLDPATLQRCDANAEARRGGSTDEFTLFSGGGKSDADASGKVIDALLLEDADALDEADARGALFARIVALMQERAGVRAALIELLAAFLNGRITPLLPRARSVADEGAAVAAALLGGGSAFLGGCVSPLAEAMSAQGLEPLKSLSPCELSSLRLQSYAARGQAAAAAAAASNALAAATATAALSCEATRAFTEPFEAVHFDLCRQHRGQMVEAEALRLLLTNSMMINTRNGGAAKGGKGGGGKRGAKNGGSDAGKADSAAAPVPQDPDAIRVIPQYHGPAREAVLAAAKTLEIELNSAESGPLNREATTAGPYHPQQVSSAVTSLNHSVGLLAAGSMQRAEVVRSAAAAAASAAAAAAALAPGETATLPPPPAPSQSTSSDDIPAPRGSLGAIRGPGATSATAGSGVDSGRGYEPADFDGLYEETSMLSLDEMSSTLTSALRTLGQALADEASAALEALQAEDDRVAAGAQAKAAAKAARQQQPAQAVPTAPSAAAAAGEADAAAAAAAGGKKAPKAVAAAAKAGKKGRGAAGVVLGSGTAEVRAWLLQQSGCAPAAAAEAGEAGEAAAAASAAAAAVPSPEALWRAMDPWECGPQGLGAFAAALIERLGSGGTQRKPKIAKGTRDFGPDQMRVREQAFAAIRRVFKRHGAVEIDTPVFELKETLTGKYGEDQKLIYDLADQGGELLALRYDLTVPFARFLALNAVGNIKRYHIAKVYRRDQPNLQRGRFREFYQCDFDVAGTYGTMVADSEVVSVACEILSSLDIGEFEVKLNHRRLLDAMLDLCGCPAEKTRSICSAVDKLDKLPWEEVRREMVEDKGLAGDVADRIGGFVTYRGEPHALWRQLTENKAFGDHADAAAAMAELRLLFDYLEALGTLQYVTFDLSLARGLDYYTGLIYECVIKDGETKVGSIAAGGRYDKLVGMFSASDQQVPCVGVSIGVERVFAIMEARMAAERAASNGPAAPSNKGKVEVYVASVGKGLLPLRMRIARTLWDADISAEYSTQDNPKMKRQLDEVLERAIPFMVIAGEDEAARGVVKLKDMSSRTEEDISMAELAAALLAKGCATVFSESSLPSKEQIKESS